MWKPRRDSTTPPSEAITISQGPIERRITRPNIQKVGSRRKLLRDWDGSVKLTGRVLALKRDKVRYEP